MLRRSLTCSAVALLCAFGSVACSDEDNDGATTDEELEEIDEGTEDVGDELEQEVEQGREEVRY